MITADPSVYRNLILSTPVSSYQSGQNLALERQKLAEQQAIAKQQAERQQKEYEFQNQERERRKALEAAYAQGIKQNPDGNMSFDPSLALKGLAGGGFGQQAYELQQSLASQKLAEQDRALKLASQSIDDQYKKAQIGKLFAETNQLKMKPNDRIAKLTEAEKTVDKDFGKDYSEWTSGGRSRAENEINKMKEVVERMKSGKGTTGGLTGILPDRLTSADVLKNRADVQQSAMTLIKQLLSGATSDKDRESIINTLWNEADSTENNIARIERFTSDMKSRLADMDKKASFYEANRTLSGFKPVTESQRWQNTQKPNDFINPVKIYAPDGTLRTIPKSQLQNAIAAGGKLAE